MDNQSPGQYQTLVSASQLAALVDQRSDNALVIVDCRFSLTAPEQGRAEYESGHIPGAMYAHLDDDLAGPVTAESGRHPLPDPALFRGFVASMGVTSDAQVVCYDHGAGAIAARLWWMMRWIGHQRVAVLDGGYKAWIAGDYPISDDMAETSDKAVGHASSDPADSSGWLSTADLVNDMRNLTVLDARSPDRFRGDNEPIDRKGGHIPGAINVDFRHNLDQDGRFQSASILRERFLNIPAVAAAGANESYDTIVHSCGSGVTACHNLLAMEVAGLHGSRLYPGSWSEWIADETRPIAIGDN